MYHNVLHEWTVYRGGDVSNLFPSTPSQTCLLLHQPAGPEAPEARAKVPSILCLSRLTLDSHMADGAVEGEASAVEALWPLGGLATVDTLNLEVNTLVDRRLHLDILEDLKTQQD